MEITEGVFRNQRCSLYAHTSDGFRYPGRIASKEFVVFGGSQMAHQAQLNDKLIDQFLGFFFRQRPPLQIALDIDIQEGGRSSQRSGRSVVLLNTGQVSQVHKLYGLTSVGRRLAQVDSILCSHGLNFFQCAHLLAELFPDTDQLIGHRTVGHLNILLFLLDQIIDAVERNSPVIADDPASSIGIGKAGQKAVMSCNLGSIGISIEHTFIVGFTEFMKTPFDFRIHFISVLLQGGFSHTDTAVEVDHAFERSICLKSYDHFVFLINVSRLKVIDTGNYVSFYIINTMFDLFQQQLFASVPDFFRSCGGSFQKRVVAAVGRYVFLNKIPYIDHVSPVSAIKSFPFFAHVIFPSI